MQNLTNQRLMRLREKMAPYSFKLEWLAGKVNCIADALSRAPHFHSSDQEPDEGTKIATAAINIKQLQEAKDDVYQQTIQAIISDSKPNRTTKLYKGIWDHMATRDGLLVYDNSRLVVPPSLIKPILDGLHQSHNCINKPCP